MDRFLPLAERVYAWLNPYLSRLAVALLVLLIGFIAGKLLGRFVRRVLDEVELDYALKKTVGIKLSVAKLLGGFVAFLVYFVTVVLFLNRLGLTAVVLNTISVGVVVLLVVSAALAIRDFVPNLVAGVMLLKKRRVKPGDCIELERVSGKVVEVSLLDTQLRTSGGDVVFIPNATLVKSVVKKKRN